MSNNSKMKLFGGKGKKQANQKRSIRADGQRFELTSVSAASGLVLEEEQPEEALPPPPPPVPRGAAFLSLMKEARTSSTDATTTQTTTEEGRPVEQNTAARPERMIRKPQLIRQPVTYGLIDEDEEECDQRQRGIEGDRKRHTTAVSYCKKKHVQLVCHWSSSDPTNRRGTWRLEPVDHRKKIDFFENGVEDHKKCSYTKQADLLNDLGKRMIREFERNEDELYDMKSQKQKDRDHRNGIEKKKSPPLVQVVRALGDLAVYTKGATGVDDDKAKITSDDNNNKNSLKKDVNPKKLTKRDIELARLRRKMEEREQARVADQKRVERSLEEQSQRQRSANSMTPANALLGTYSSKSGQATTKEGTQVPEHHDEAARLQTKERANAETYRRRLDDKLEEKCKSYKPEESIAKSRLTKEERTALRNIKAAQMDEATRLEEFERAEEERLLQLVSDKALAGAKAVESDEEDGLTNAIEGVVDDGVSRDAATLEDRMTKLQKAKVSPALTHSSGGPKPAIKAASKPGTRETKKVSLADYLAAKAAARGEMTVKQFIAPKAMETLKEAPTKEDNSKTLKSAKAKKVQNSKLYKSAEFIVDSDIEYDTKEAAVLPTDKLKENQVSVKTTGTEQTIATTKHGSKIARELVETSIVAGKVEQDNEPIERTEVTDITADSSNPSEHLEVTVEHTTHVQAIPALEVTSRALPHDMSPLLMGRELQADLHAPSNVPTLKTAVTSPPALLSTTSPSSPTSDIPSQKRKHQENSGETSASDVDSAVQATPSPSKKRKISPPYSPVKEGSPDSSSPSAPSASDDHSPSPNRESDSTEAKLTSSPPTSPGAISETSSTSSTSSKKRKMRWSEEGGEVTISPGGTKRVKRVQFSTEVLTSSTETVEDLVETSQDAKMEGTPEQGKEKGGESAEIIGQPVALEAENSGMQHEDEDEYRSLFGSSPATSSKDEEDGDAKEGPSIGAKQESDDFESLFGSPRSS